MEKVTIRSKADPSETKSVSARDARVLVKIGRWEYETSALRAGPPRRRERGELAGPAFASPAAQGAAAEIDPAVFAGRTGSGKDGAFTKADVVGIAEQLAAGDRSATEPPAE